MCNRVLLLIYYMSLENGGPKIHWMEQSLGFEMAVATSADDMRNEPEMYSAIFSEECRANLETVYVTLLRSMRAISFEECDDLLEALVFLQKIASTALWKYRQNIGQQMEDFARSFDRLDVLSERMRLYQYAQAR